MTLFLPEISHAARNRVGGLDGAYESTPAPIAARGLGLNPPNTDSLGGTMTAGGAEYSRSTTVLIDPATGFPVTLVRVWSIQAPPTAAPIAILAFNADGSAYTGSIANLELPSGSSRTSASEGSVSGIYQDTLTIAAQNVIPPLTKPWKRAPGAFANIIAGAATFTSGNGVVLFHDGGTNVAFDAAAAGFNLNPGDTVVAQYSA